jgi:hypothetical protein
VGQVQIDSTLRIAPWFRSTARSQEDPNAGYESARAANWTELGRGVH